MQVAAFRRVGKPAVDQLCAHVTVDRIGVLCAEDLRHDVGEGLAHIDAALVDLPIHQADGRDGVDPVLHAPDALDVFDIILAGVDAGGYEVHPGAIRQFANVFGEVTAEDCPIAGQHAAAIV